MGSLKNETLFKKSSGLSIVHSVPYNSIFTITTKNAQLYLYNCGLPDDGPVRPDTCRSCWFVILL